MKNLEQLYLKEKKRMVGTMSRILRGDYAAGEDVVQEAFTRAVKFYHSYDSQRASLKTWFNSILYNALRDAQRASRGAPEEITGEISVEDLFTVEELSKSPELSGYIQESVNSVTNVFHRRILELFFIFGYTTTEISQVEDITVSNATTIVNRFRKEMRV